MRLEMFFQSFKRIFYDYFSLPRLRSVKDATPYYAFPWGRLYAKRYPKKIIILLFYIKFIVFYLIFIYNRHDIIGGNEHGCYFEF
jgi:hypothetical protein